ncbi:hypothetical protein [Spirosoma oryzicola]|uniref:hypothetical protein n=1 Tax=Spirosoma oryzicola TaxID=2898794 RepID=UPI001E337AA5|nr:hypothetical protein [Spirosoma oryzicola]UHG94706.1 hypothetical protein LQ777_29350 [Spirosoma oryzicola]
MILSTHNTSAVSPVSFYDAFRVIDAYIKLRSDLDSIKDNRNYNNVERLTEEAAKPIAKLLLNSWSAEYALRITPIVNDEQYLQSSLHWTFPQAYYSVLFSARAFLSSQGFNLSSEDLIRKQIANLVVLGYYPESTSYYAIGSTYNLKIHRLHKNMPVVGDFLRETRSHNQNALFRSMQTNPKTALRSKITGSISSVVDPDQARALSKSLGYTSYFDLLTRLRISSTSRDVEQLLDSNFNVSKFHTCLNSIVTHINSVHELYVAKAIGMDSYLKMISQLPDYLKKGFVGDRTASLFA